VKGAVSGAASVSGARSVSGDLVPNDATPEETGRVDLQVILQTKIKPKTEKITAHHGTGDQNLHLAIYAATAKEPNWTDIVESFRKTTAELKGARLLRMLSSGNIFNVIRNVYMGILWRDFSIDLVAASLRQREFATKITSIGCAGIDTPLALIKATTRYHKFLLLMNRKSNGKDKRVALVPTLDIDLCWHTHQLYADSYRQWCMDHLGVAINHDDTVGKESLDTGLRETNQAWRTAYRESYTTDNLPEAKNRKMSGGLLLNLFSRKKMEKMPQTKNGIIIVFEGR
jgi:hypothetical protein